MNRIFAVVLAFGLASILVFCAIQIDTGQVNLDVALRSPSFNNALLGTDVLGRPIARQLAVGLQNSVRISLVVTLVSLFLGIGIGFLAAFQNLLGRAVSRAIDVAQGLPTLLVAIVVTAMLGAGFLQLVFAFVVLGWIGYARVVRAEALRIQSTEYVYSAKTAGASVVRILKTHVLPNMWPLLLVQTTFGFGAVILGESTLSFLGLGDPTLPSLGKQLAEGVDYLRVAPHLVVIPGFVLSAVILGANLGGDWLQDRANERFR